MPDYSLNLTVRFCAIQGGRRCHWCSLLIGEWGGCLIPLQRRSQSILQPQLIALAWFESHTDGFATLSNSGTYVLWVRIRPYHHWTNPKWVAIREYQVNLVYGTSPSWSWQKNLELLNCVSHYQNIAELLTLFCNTLKKDMNSLLQSNK